MKDGFVNRKYIIIALFVFAFVALMGRLLYIQIIESSYRLSADNNVLRYVTQYPARGLIYDRNGKLIVSNMAAYDVMVIPSQTTKIDTVEFCSLLGISNDLFKRQMRAAINYSRRVPSVFLKQISDETYAKLQEKMYLYPGFYVQPRTLRKYSKPVAAHILGYVSEADANTVKNNPYYKSGDYIGKSGIEESYENELRGKKGVNIYMVDVFNRIKGSYDNGKMDTTATQGLDVISTIDLDLQEYGEILMQNKRGSIVAIEPQTGETLALVTAPNYDPALLVGRMRSENFTELQSNTVLPLFNRALMAIYPPGSTFKPINGLIGLQENVIDASTRFSCEHGYLFVGCHSHLSPLNLVEAVANSCNSYFCQTFRRILENGNYGSIEEAYGQWKKYLDEFGFGNRLETDFVNELRGFIPESTYYDRYYGRNRWRALTVISLAIGQGEITTTPLQMANATAAIANRGYYYTPHIVKGIGEAGIIDSKFTEKHHISIDPANFEKIIDGMEGATGGIIGATATVAAIPGIDVCGKTGTAQNPHGDDHSIFIAFAPKDNPKIAIAVYVENAGFGATYAAPIASLMMEKYLTGNISNPAKEQRILDLNLEDKLLRRNAAQY